jgi:hypothetical protein
LQNLFDIASKTERNGNVDKSAQGLLNKNTSFGLQIQGKKFQNFQSMSVPSRSSQSILDVIISFLN